MELPEANPYAATAVEGSLPKFSVGRGLLAMGGGALVGLALGTLSSAPFPEPNHINVTLAWLFGFAAFTAYAPPPPHRLLHALGTVGLIGIASLMLIGGLAEALFDLPTGLKAMNLVRERIFACAGVAGSVGSVLWACYVGKKRTTEVPE